MLNWAHIRGSFKVITSSQSVEYVHETSGVGFVSLYCTKRGCTAQQVFMVVKCLDFSTCPSPNTPFFSADPHVDLIIRSAANKKKNPRVSTPDKPTGLQPK